MTKSKKLLSLILALTIVLGSLGTVFAADQTVVSVSSQFLKSKGVIVGNERGDLMLADNLLRRDSVIMLSRLLNEEYKAKTFEGNTSWADVTNQPKIYIPYFAWAESNGYFVGKDNNTFGPTEALKAPEYAVVLLRALEYDIKGYDSWKAVLENAEKIGLLQDLDLKFESILTRGEMAIMTFNALGTKINGKDETLAQRLNIELPKVDRPEAEVLGIKEVRTENLKEVIVELTKSKLDNKDVEKLENINNYRLVGFKVEKATKVDDKVILELDKELIKGKKYDLTIRNVAREVNKTYNFTSYDNTLPKVEKVEVLGEYGIKITTSEPIKDARERDFNVDGKNITTSIEKYGRTMILTPYHNEKFSKDVKKVTVKSLEDFAGYKSVEETFDVEMKIDTEAPEVVKVTQLGKILEVEFKKDIYKKSLKSYKNNRELGNISFASGRVDEFAKEVEKIDTNKVRYTFERELPRKATVTIEGVENHSGVVMNKVTKDVEESLNYSEPEIIESKIETDVTERTATITLEFDREIEGRLEKGKDEFEIANHVSLYEREVGKRDKIDNKIKSLEYGKNKRFVVVKIEDLTLNNERRDFDYILEVRNFTDLSTLRNRMYTDYVEFELTREDSKFKLESVSLSEKRLITEITLRFNNSVDSYTAERADNFLILDKKDGKLKDINELDGKIFIENKGKDIIIELPDFDKSKYDYMLVSRNIKDIDRERLDKDYRFNFSTGSISNGQYTLTEVNGKFHVTPNLGVDKITLQSELKGEFVIKGNLVELVVDTPNADVVVAEGVTVETIKIYNIAKDSLGVDGVVKNLVVLTNRTFSVYGKVADIQVITTENKIIIRVGQSKTGQYKEVELIKGKTTDLGTELGIEKHVKVELKVSSDGKDVLGFELLDGEKLVKAEEGKFNLVVGKEYTVRSDGFEPKVIKILSGDKIVVELVKNKVVDPVIPVEPGVEVIVKSTGLVVENFKIIDSEGKELKSTNGKYKFTAGSIYTVVSEGYKNEHIAVTEEIKTITVELIKEVIIEVSIKLAETEGLDASKFVIKDSKGKEIELLDGKYKLIKGNKYTVKAEGFYAKEIVAEGLEVEVVLIAEVELLVQLNVKNKDGEVVQAFVITDSKGPKEVDEEGKYKLVEGYTYKIVSEGYETFEVKVTEGAKVIDIVLTKLK